MFCVRPYVVRFLRVKISQSCVFCVRPYVVRFLRVKISQSCVFCVRSVCGSVSTYRDITVRACSVFVRFSPTAVAMLLMDDERFFRPGILSDRSTWKVSLSSSSPRYLLSGPFDGLLLRETHLQKNKRQLNEPYEIIIIINFIYKVKTFL